MLTIGLLLVCCAAAIAIGLSCTGGSCLSCEDCNICTDDFNRADGTNITTGSPCSGGWSERSGSAWSLSSGRLLCTTAGQAICFPQHPDNDPYLSAQSVIHHDTNGSSCFIVIGRVSDTDYYRALYTFATGTGGTIKLQKVTGGTPTNLNTPGWSSGTRTGVTLNVNTDYTAKVCVNENNTITAYLNGTPMITSYVQPITGDRAGLGAVGSGTAEFDDWVLDRTDGNCPECDPYWSERTCEQNEEEGNFKYYQPHGVRLISSGWASGVLDEDFCDDATFINYCLEFDGTYDLEFFGTFNTTSGFASLYGDDSAFCDIAEFENNACEHWTVSRQTSCVLTCGFEGGSEERARVVFWNLMIAHDTNGDCFLMASCSWGHGICQDLDNINEDVCLQVYVFKSEALPFDGDVAETRGNHTLTYCGKTTTPVTVNGQNPLGDDCCDPPASIQVLVY
jgi:hypothetical protein